MISNHLVAGSRSQWLRLRPRTTTILSMVMALAVVGCDQPPSPDRRHREIVAQLGDLLAENGLFMRPGMSPDGEPSWAASAYGYAALATTGQPVPTASLVPATLSSLLSEQIAGEPLWGRWYAVQVEQAAGVQVPGSWAAGLLQEFTLPQDPAGQVASIAAVVEVARAKAIPIPPARARELSSQLGAAAARLTSAFSWCRALDAAAGLGTSGWTVPEFAEVSLGQAFSAPALMEVYGTLCVLRHQRRTLDEQQRVRIRDWLRPQLSLDVAGFELEADLAARSWLAAGGERTQLQAMADKLRQRIDRQTGLLRQHVTRLGTLENTYYAAVIADTIDAAPRLIKPRTLGAVRDVLSLARDKTAISDLLMGAVILRLADRPDAAQEQEAGDLARRWLLNGVNRGNVVRAALVTTLLQQLGQRFEPLRAAAFPLRDREDQYLAWTMLSISHHLSNGPEIRRALSTATSQVGVALSAPDELAVREIAVAMRVPDSGLDRNRLPAPLVAWSAAVRGCNGYSALYRPIRSERRCTLEATAQMIAAGLSQADPPAAGEGK